MAVLLSRSTHFVIVEVHRDHDPVEDADPGHDTHHEQHLERLCSTAARSEQLEFEQPLQPIETGIAGKFSNSARSTSCDTRRTTMRSAPSASILGVGLPVVTTFANKRVKRAKTARSGRCANLEVTPETGRSRR